MNTDLLKVGDQVIVQIEKESRDWGYNPCPDGTVATVVGFSEVHYGRVHNFGKRPGVYENRSWIKLRREDGKEWTEFATRFKIADEQEYERRLVVLRQQQQADPNWKSDDHFMRELPETPFWEGDFVFVDNRKRRTDQYCTIDSKQDPYLFQIVRIDYNQLNTFASQMTPYPVYQVSSGLTAGWSISVSAEELTLKERGPVWKFYHDEAITFVNLEDEARFADLIGQTTEVRNHANDLYKWSKDEVLMAISLGLVHGFSLSSGFFGSGPSIRAIRFKDEELGKRVATETLKGFNMVAA